MEYITPKEAAEKWGITERRVQALCAKGKIDGVVRFSKVWAIPKNAAKPRDGRYKVASL
ncbi:helix-turn-helix domain-containing protein [Lachnospiraceae bacterium ZAX-1]